MKIFGLTGSIAMGKTHIKTIIEKLGIQVYDSDRVIAELYTNKAIINKIIDFFPECVINGQVDKKKLGDLVFLSKKALKTIEDLLYPYVRKHRESFTRKCKEGGEKAIVLDIPLLFEKERESECDIVIVVTAPEALQKERAMTRPYMTEEKFNKILEAQMSNEEKIKKADYVIYNDPEHRSAIDQVKTIFAKEGILL